MATSSVMYKQGQKVAVMMSSFFYVDNPSQAIIRQATKNITHCF